MKEWRIARIFLTTEFEDFDRIISSAPAKPEKPTVVATGKDAMSVIYHFAVGGGWTHEFKVLYRKKGEQSFGTLLYFSLVF